MKPTIGLKTSGPGERAIMDSMKTLTRQQVYVGVPATTAHERRLGVEKRLSRRTSKRAAAKLAAARKEQINNAQLVFLHTFGSPLKHIPARPIIEAAITEQSNREAITAELKLAAEAALAGNSKKVTKQLKLAGIEAQNRTRAWFKNPKNNWAANQPATIKRKGSSRPLIDTSAMRNSIIFLVG